MAILNTPADLAALKGTPDYAAALQILLGSTQTWVNQAAAGAAPNWQLVSTLTTIQAMGFMSVDELLAECAAVGVAAPPPPAQPAPPLLEQLVAALTSAAGAATTAIIAQIFPTPASQAALQNAALLIQLNGGTAPTTGANATALAALATAYGSNTTNFAGMVTTAVTQSLMLETALATLNAAATTATTAVQLATALSTFETAIGGVVTAMNAVLAGPLTATAPISIAGINA